MTVVLCFHGATDKHDDSDFIIRTKTMLSNSQCVANETIFLLQSNFYMFSVVASIPGICIRLAAPGRVKDK